MPKPIKPTQPKSWLWATLTSIRLTVFLLLVLAGVAVVGTVLPQNQPLGYYVANYGETLGRILWRTGLANIYNNFWFLLPITLLALNIMACVVHGLPRAVQRSLQPFTGEMGLNLPERGKFTWPGRVDPRPLIEAAVRRELGPPRKETLPDKEIYLYQKGRWRPLGPYLVHLALLLILAGGLIGKFWGIEGQLPILIGESAEGFRDEQGTVVPLHFQVRLDNFQVQYYEEGGTPKEFRSDLTFSQDGREVQKAVCRVNFPVEFRGFTFYQTSYGSQPSGPARLRVRRGEVSQTLEAPLRKLVDLPGGEAQVMVVRADGNLQGYGPAVQLALKTGSGHPLIFWVVQNHPELTEQPAPYHFELESLPLQSYSVFSVKRDPGVWWVYAGFILLLPGFYLAFFRPAQRWAVVLEQTPKKAWQARLLGASPRNREEFANTQERLAAELKKGVSS